MLSVYITITLSDRSTRSWLSQVIQPWLWGLQMTWMSFFCWLSRLADCYISNYLMVYLQNGSLFGPEEFHTLHTNLSHMQTDIRLQYQDALDKSHHRRPTLIQTIQTGHRGCLCIVIDPEFLQWAYSHRSVLGISRFLDVNWDMVQNALLDYSIAELHQNPFQTHTEVDRMSSADNTFTPEDDPLDPHLPIPAELPPDVAAATAPPIHTPPNSTTSSGPSMTSYMGPLSMLTNDELDDLILPLRSHFFWAGLSMLNRMLHHLGHRVPRERISASLMHIDPIQYVFQCICIWCRKYILSLDWCPYGIMMVSMVSFDCQLCRAVLTWSKKPHLMGHCDTWFYWWIFTSNYWPLCQ